MTHIHYERYQMMLGLLRADAESTRVRPTIVAMLATVAFAALLVRCVSIAEPLGIDQSLWASAVRGMARGQHLYQDVWEQRPPGIYWIYLAGFSVFGWTASTVAWLDIVASAATTLLLYAIARPLAGSLSGALAATLYAVLTMPAWLYGNGGFLERSVCETFIVLFVGLSFWCAVRLRNRTSAALAIGVGVFSGAAVVLKPNAGLYFPAVLLWIWCYRRESSPTLRQPSGRLLVMALLGAALLPAITILWLWRLGLLQEAGIAVIDFNRFYVAQGFTVGDYALAFSKAVWLRTKTDPLWLAGGVGSVFAVWDLARRRSLPPLAGLAVIWGGASAVVIVVNGARLFNSYFIQTFAPLALLAGWLLTDAVRGSLIRRLIGTATVVLMLTLLVQRDYVPRVLASAGADFDVLRGRLDQQAYLQEFGDYGNNRGYSARANAELAAYIRQHTSPEERVFLFGINGAGVYFAADRLSAHRFLRVNFFVPPEFPDPRFRLEAVTRDLSAARPRYIVFERLHSTSDPAVAKAVDTLTDHPDIRELLRAYQFDTTIEDFTLYRLVD